MKTLKKILPIFTSFFVFSLMASLFLQPMAVMADGEKYTYKDANTIEASGGNFKEKTTFKKGPNSGKLGTYNDDTFAFYAEGVAKSNDCKLLFALTVPKSKQSSGTIPRIRAANPGDAIGTKCAGSEETIVNSRGFSRTLTIANSPDAKEEEEAANQQPEARCELESLGWIICPVLITSAKTITLMAQFLNKMLFFDPLSIPTNTDLKTIKPEQVSRVAIFVIWQNVRNIANILFLLFFMFAIFSIATSMGMSNYSAKKILPRVVVAALLINLSYYIFAFAIDISNVLGQGIAQILSIEIPSSQESNYEILDLGLYGIGALVGVTGLALTGVLAAFLLPFIAAVLVGIFLLLLLVLFREIAITFCVVLSPVAAAFWILPNAGTVPSRFVTTSRNLLLIYPFLMGAVAFSNVGAQIILAIGYSS